MRTSLFRGVGRLLLMMAVGMCTIATSAAQTGTYPTKTIRIVVPYLAGGGPDAVARLLGERLSKALGQPVIIDNKPGAAGSIGAQQVAQAAPDGYTLLLTASGLVQAPHLTPNSPYDPVRDFAPISHVGGTHLGLFINAKTPANTAAEFVAYAKANTGKLNYASYGTGSLSNMFGEIFNDVAGLNLTHVPYKGDSPALVDLLEGRVEAAFLSVFFVRSYVESGRIRALAVTGSTRSPLLPQVPTFGEIGFRSMDAQGWFGLLGPAGLPAAIQQKISAEVVNILKQEDVRSKLLSMGIVAGGSTPQVFADMVKHDFEMYGTLFKRYKIQTQ
ncbi:MAG: tripartite tricarboxylate transporter substrate binding protein [Burkholderiales bacterium]|nr:tripartite tricarboxylate transporter substrate binding protein [Burkholderiales bacterium]ODU70337.1 MAG: hypothetical protein ABT05_01660 [Lautropia sp. SCN 66-9]